MKKESILREKSSLFSLQVLDLYNFLKDEKREHVICRQLLRSGTAIGALVREAEFAQSKADFINKLSIALKEANETEYWIELLSKSNYIPDNSFNTTYQLLSEIIKILVSSVKTAKGLKV